MTDWSAMAWEPCILKHGPHYEDPWLTIGINENWVNPRQKKVCVDFGDGEVVEFVSIAAAARELGFDGKMCNFANVEVFCRRNGMRLSCVP